MVKVSFAGVEYDVPNIITIGSISFDVTKANVFPDGKPDKEGELARLYLDILPVSERKIATPNGEITIPAKKGIDLSTATISEIKAYLSDDTIKKSRSITSLCQRVMSVRFPTDFTRSNISEKTKKEYNAREKDTDFLGESGFVG